MNMHRIKTIALALVLSVGPALSANASDLKSVLQVGQAKTDAAQKSQKKIDKLADETTELLRDYKTQIKLVEDLKVYNRKLELQIEHQEKRLANLEQSIVDVTVIQRQIMPLLTRMLDALEEFVDLDVPFLQQERQDRIAKLRDNLDRSDLSSAEKFRQVLEAYKIENEYGRKLETYKDSINIDGVDREVNMFRVGRVALVYQTTDTDISGAWDQASRQWVELDSGDYRNAILKGIRVAKKQASIDILELPIAAPEARQ